MAEPSVVVRATISDAPLEVDAVTAELVSASDGGLVVFSGIVRDHDDDRSVRALEYEAHPDAAARLEEVARSVAERIPGVRIAVVHRIGALEVGDVAVVAAVVAAHRAEAFEACALLVDELKREVPIWKRQRFADGASEWVGLCASRSS